jgi:hypothetical protein
MLFHFKTSSLDAYNTCKRGEMRGTRVGCPVRKTPLGRQRNILDATMKLHLQQCMWTEFKRLRVDSVKEIKLLRFLHQKHSKFFFKKKNPSCAYVQRTVQYSSHGIPEL